MKNPRHGTIAALLACVALAACSGRQPGPARVNLQALQQVAQGVARGADRVSVGELSHWIVAGRKDFVLLDIRTPYAYAAGHIEGAQSVPLAELVTEARLAALPAALRLIVYADDSTDAAAAVALLRVAGRDAQLVSGGYAAWERQVLHPDVPTVASVDEAPVLAEKRAIACYFVGGKGGGTEAPVYAPAAKAAFVPPVSTAPPPQPKRHGEGC